MAEPEFADNAKARVLDHLGDPVLVIAPDGTLRYANHAAVCGFGWPADELIGTNVLRLVHPDDLALTLAALTTVDGKAADALMDVRVTTATGERYFEVRGAGRYGDDDIGGAIVVARDITDRRRMELAANDIERLRQLVHHTAALLLFVDQAGRIRSINGAVTRVLGLDPELVVGRSLVDLAVRADRAAVATALREAVVRGGSVTFDATFVHADGSELGIEFTAVNLVDDPVVGGLVVSGQPATSLQHARALAGFLASHDPLTELPNRDGFYEHVAMLAAPDLRRAIVYLGLDRFKGINELFTQSVGDALLVAVARRLEALARPGEVVARYGGDEFVLAFDVTCETGAQERAAEVEEALAPPFHVDAGEIRLAASIGVALVGGGGIEEAVAEAARAMTAVKQRQRGNTPTGRTSRIAERRLLVDQLFGAVSRGELRAHYHPIRTVATGQLVGFEALVRWEHPKRGVLDPAEFLSLVTLAGLENEVGARILRQAARQLSAAMVDRADQGLSVHVNITPRQLAAPDFADTVAGVLGETSLTPLNLWLEITEHDILRTGDVELANLATLRELGVRIAIDDFGTGYSSMVHLLELPVDALKIDRRFVTDVARSRTSAGLVTAVIGLTRSLGLVSVAEGVEDLEQLAALRRLGCDQFQGYLSAQPLKPEDLAASLDEEPVN